MHKTKQEKRFRNLIAQQLSSKEELHQYEDSFHRWLAREINCGRFTMKQAIDDFKISHSALWHILKVYHPSSPNQHPIVNLYHSTFIISFIILADS